MNRNIRIFLLLALYACGEPRTQIAPHPAKRGAGSSTGSEASVPKVHVASVSGFQVSCNSRYAPKPQNDPSPMCLVPAGEFVMGTPVEPIQPEAMPARRIRISTAFYIDQYEVTNEQFARFLGARPLECTKANNYCMPSVLASIDFDSSPPSVKTGEGRLPARVTFTGAQAYCGWAGKRLPTEAEWEYAARHDPVTSTDRIYPWGDHYVDGITNHFGAVERKRGRIVDVGRFKDDRSAIGAVDMGGNAWEWVADCHSLELGCTEPCSPAARLDHCENICNGLPTERCEPARLVKGGSVMSSREELASKRREATSSDTPNGFRCVVDQ